MAFFMNKVFCGLFFAYYTFIMKQLLLFLTFIFLTLPVFSQLQYFEGSIDEAFAYAQKHKQNVFVDVYTDWCHYCKVLDKTTFKDERIIETLNTGYVVLKVNAQKGEGKQFAAKQRVSGYPTMLILKYDGSTYKRIPGYLTADQLIGVIDQFKTKPSKVGKKKEEEDNNEALSYLVLDTTYYTQNIRDELNTGEYEAFSLAKTKGGKNDYEWYELGLTGKYKNIMELGFMIGQGNWSKLKSKEGQELLKKYSVIEQSVMFTLMLNDKLTISNLKTINEAYLREKTRLNLYTKLCAEVILDEDYSDTLSKYKKVCKKEKLEISEFVKRL